MRIENVKIIVVEDYERRKDYHAMQEILAVHKRDGRYISTATEINVNKTQYGYSVIIPSSEYKIVDNTKYSSEILKLFMRKLPDTIFNFTLSYYHTSLDECFFDPEVAGKVLGLNYYLGRVADTETIEVFRFEQDDENMKGLHDYLIYEEESDDDDDEDEDDDGYDTYDEEDEDEDDDDDEDLDPFKFLMNGSFDSDRKSRSKTKKGKVIQTSRCLKNASKPKRSINRHGVMIASKSDIDKDRKIIKEFLKEFIPGGGWRKEFREEVLNRWIASFAISKKKLNNLQKKHDKKKSNGRRKRFSHTMANAMLNAWNNPCR